MDGGLTVGLSGASDAKDSQGPVYLHKRFLQAGAASHVEGTKSAPAEKQTMAKFHIICKCMWL